MSDETRAKLIMLQSRLTADAARVTNREDYYRLRMYWNDVAEVITALDSENRNG